MQLKTDINVVDFLSSVKKCSSEVFFETTEGDSLVLTSALSQYIFCFMGSQPDLLKNGIVRLTNPDDRDILSEYLCE